MITKTQREERETERDRERRERRERQRTTEDVRIHEIETKRLGNHGNSEAEKQEGKDREAKTQRSSHTLRRPGLAQPSKTAWLVSGRGETQWNTARAQTLHIVVVSSFVVQLLLFNGCCSIVVVQLLLFSFCSVVVAVHCLCV